MTSSNYSQKWEDLPSELQAEIAKQVNNRQISKQFEVFANNLFELPYKKNLIYKKIRRIGATKKDNYQNNKSKTKKQVLKTMFTRAFHTPSPKGGSYTKLNPSKRGLKAPSKEAKSAPGRLNTVSHTRMQQSAYVRLQILRAMDMWLRNPESTIDAIRRLDPIFRDKMMKEMRRQGFQDFHSGPDFAGLLRTFVRVHRQWERTRLFINNVPMLNAF